jgi:CheY-like chemotaxis protein
MKKKILLVDDDQDLIRSFQVTLAKNDFDVITASNGREGFALLKKEKPDLAVLDVMMDSTLEGYNMLHSIKEDPSLKSLPVIICTGMLDELGVNLYSAVEEHDFLPNVRFVDKPVEPEALTVLIREMLK